MLSSKECRMKRFLLPLVAISLLFVSCASSPTESAADNGPTQENLDQAFEEVYNHFDHVLIMEGAKKYQVKSGDTLSSIAKEFYGKDNGYYFPLIMLASSQTILDPDKIEPGMALTVPNLEKNLNDTSAHQNMKKFFQEIADVYKTKKTATATKTRDELLKIASML